MEKDSLTSLLQFDDFVVQAQEVLDKWDRKSKMMIVSIDFSKFKYINRIYGYDIGNGLVKALADDLSSQDDFIMGCRPYSDHVVSLFLAKDDPEEMNAVLRRAHQAFTDYHRVLYPKISLHLNVGVCYVSPEDDAITQAIDRANIARRSAKGNYSVHFVEYTEEHFKLKENENRLIPLFEKALEEGNIQVYLQPKYSVKEQVIVGAEALSRLLDEDGKIIPPDSFVPVLENSGKVLDLDWYVMKYVFTKIRDWLAEGRRVVPVSINLSKLHFYYDDLVDRIIEEFEKYDFSPEYIEFEVTESVFFEEAELIIHKIEKLRERGFKVSVDDFGAGYSSLNLIGILPVDTIKLDKGFIKNSLGNKRGKDIIKGLISILNEIDLDIVCEGIETKEEEREVYEFGCDSMQGFLYDRPIPVEIFEQKYILQRIS